MISSLEFLQKSLGLTKINYTNLDLYIGKPNENENNRKVIVFLDLSCLYRFIYGKTMKFKRDTDNDWEEDIFFKDSSKIKMIQMWVNEILNVIAHYRHYFNTRYRATNIFYLYISREENRNEFFDKINEGLKTYISYIPGVFITDIKQNLNNFIRNLAITLSIEKTKNFYINISKNEYINAILYSILDNLHIIQYEKGEIVYKDYENLYPEFIDLFKSQFYKYDIKKLMYTILLARKYDKTFSRKRKNTQALMVKNIIDEGLNFIESLSIDAREYVLNDLNDIVNDGVKEKIFNETLKNWRNKLYDKTIFHINDNQPKYVSDIKINWLMNND